MFDIDDAASEAELRDLGERCEQRKSAAAGAQARATALLAALWAAKRRDADTAPSLPAPPPGR